MPNFLEFRDRVRAQIQKMIDSGTVYAVEIGAEEANNAYVECHIDDTIFRKRLVHDCSCCKAFNRRIGNMVSFNPDGSLNTIWDIDTTGLLPIHVAFVDRMSTFVKSKSVNGLYFSDVAMAGMEKNIEPSSLIQFEHHYFKLPMLLVKSESEQTKINSVLRENVDILKRSFEVFTKDSFDTVLSLINAKDIYRGTEFRDIVTKVANAFKEYQQTPILLRTKFFWEKAKVLGTLCAFKNTSIGSLVWDLSTGEELDVAVKIYESKVAGPNYKRSTALVTPAMIEAATKKIEELGLESALYRRFANASDININNTLFINRHPDPVRVGILGDLTSTKPVNPKSKDCIQVTIEEFIIGVIPTASNIEVLMTDRHAKNMMSLITATDPNAAKLFKWDNQFSWSYVGGFTDTIKEKVKAAGGEVDGEARISLEWFNTDDLDLHVITPHGEIYFSSRKVANGTLDVDANGMDGIRPDPVENVFWKTLSSMPNGHYKVGVHNYNKRQSNDVGFNLQYDFKGETDILSYPQSLANNMAVKVLEFDVNDGQVNNITSSLQSNTVSKEIWGVSTYKWAKLSHLLKSPNHWEGEDGNLHYFFILEGCKNPTDARGIYNEYLRSDLNEHRKVFELVGDKAKADHTDNQLSGLGFSSTIKASVIVKVTLASNQSKVYEVNF